MTAAAPSLTVVMPAYNEEQGIAEAVREVQREVFSIVADAELVVVDDGSGDATGAILDRLAAEDPRVRVIHQANGGHGRALRTGLDAAAGEHVLLVDSDGQIPLSAFGPCWMQAAGAAVFGVRRARCDPRIRLALSALIRRALRVLLGVDLRDANVPFKLIRRRAWLQARPVIPEETLAPSLFLAVFMARRGYPIVQRDVPHRPRTTGRALGGRRLLGLCARACCQLLAFRWAVR